MSWSSVIVAGILPYLTRTNMVTLVNKNILSSKIKQILGYVPAAVFPAIIFPGIFLNDTGFFISLDDPKIIAATLAIIIGYFTKNVIATILSGLISYWIIIFLI